MYIKKGILFIACSVLLPGLLFACSGGTGLSDTGTPASSQTPPSFATRTINGKISYNGTVQSIHQIVIVAVRIGEQSPAYSVVIAAAGDYTLKNVIDASYTISAFMDVGDDMGPPQTNEPAGYYDASGDGKGDEVIVKDGKGIGGIDVTLRDPR